MISTGLYIHKILTKKSEIIDKVKFTKKKMVKKLTSCNPSHSVVGLLGGKEKTNISA